MLQVNTLSEARHGEAEWCMQFPAFIHVSTPGVGTQSRVLLIIALNERENVSEL